MELRKATPTRRRIGLASLPYDIFLGIVDALIEEISASEHTVDWRLEYRANTPSKIVVKDDDYLLGPPTSQITRYQLSRLPSQINRQTRSMVHRELPRATLLNRDGTISPIDAWICPEIDLFTPVLFDADQALVKQALSYPTPPCYALVQSIRWITLPDCEWITYATADIIAALGTLPNLSVIQLHIGSVFLDRLQQPVHFGFHKIDPRVFPTMAQWVEYCGPDVMDIFLPLKNNGVRLYCGFHYEPLLEICDFGTEIYFQMLDGMKPNCTCYKEDWIYEDGVENIGISEADEVAHET
ncbi:hypothetical protein CKAH01_13748 [Colletotrichum kahawae]|uniref:Uncharacterized protein n=1 Tax=Colletotrichum kahawae TaxID=34407 RepID=A0AAD9YRK6_COLKA|nr:hypothetical protein CKAH01_13748 [Colletotrichum kahawae]